MARRQGRPARRLYRPPLQSHRASTDPSFAAAAFARQIAEIEAGLEARRDPVGNLDARRDLSDVRDTVPRVPDHRGTRLAAVPTTSARAERGPYARSSIYSWPVRECPFASGSMARASDRTTSRFFSATPGAFATSSVGSRKFPSGRRCTIRWIIGVPASRSACSPSEAAMRYRAGPSSVRSC